MLLILGIILLMLSTLLAAWLGQISAESSHPLLSYPSDSLFIEGEALQTSKSAGRILFVKHFPFGPSFRVAPRSPNRKGGLKALENNRGEKKKKKLLQAIVTANVV